MVMSCVDSDDLETISGWLNDIKEEIEEDLAGKDVNPRNLLRLVGIYEIYGAAKKDERSEIGNCLANNDGAKLLTDYIRMLTDDGKRDLLPGGEDSKKLTLVIGLCVNYSHASLNFCFELGKSGLFEILVTYLERQIDSLEEVVYEDEFILPSLTILYNCAKDSRAIRYLAQAHVADILSPYINMGNKRLLVSKIVAVLTSSYPIEEGHSEKPADVAMLYIVVFYLECALSESDKRHLGFTAEELVDGLKRLAENDANKVSILNAGALPLIEKLLETGDVGEKTVAGLTLWSLCFADENQPKVSANKNIMTSLEKLSNQPGELGRLTSGALWYLTQQGRPTTSIQGGRSRPGGSDDRCASKLQADEHIMISYSSRQTILGHKIKARLENTGYRAWMDSNDGKNFEEVKEAIEKSELVIVCVSEDYRTEPSCRMEAEYARKMQIPIIPVLAESDFKMNGWLKMTLGCSACIDFSDSSSFEKAFSSLAERVGNKGKVELDAARLLETTPTSDKTLDDEASPKTPIENWTTNDVMNWATENNLAPGRFRDIDGESLAYLRDMKKNSPEFYHEYVVKKLEISDLQDLKNLSRGLEDLNLS